MRNIHNNDTIFVYCGVWTHFARVYCAYCLQNLCARALCVAAATDTLTDISLCILNRKIQRKVLCVYNTLNSWHNKHTWEPTFFWAHSWLDGCDDSNEDVFAIFVLCCSNNELFNQQ